MIDTRCRSKNRVISFYLYISARYRRPFFKPSCIVDLAISLCRDRQTSRGFHCRILITLVVLSLQIFIHIKSLAGSQISYFIFRLCQLIFIQRNFAFTRYTISHCPFFIGEQTIFNRQMTDINFCYGQINMLITRQILRDFKRYLRIRRHDFGCKGGIVCYIDCRITTTTII